jgi:hypothetical protein
MGICESISAEVICNCGELLKRSFQILHNLRRNHVGIGEVGAVFERIVFEPGAVEVEFVALTEDASRNVKRLDATRMTSLRLCR